MERGAVSKSRARALTVLLGAVAIVFLVRTIRDHLPYRPALYLYLEERLQGFDHRVIHSACGDAGLPALEEGQSIRLDLVPRPGCVYRIGAFSFTGDELIRLLELGREERADLVIKIGIDYVIPELTKRYQPSW